MNKITGPLVVIVLAGSLVACASAAPAASTPVASSNPPSASAAAVVATPTATVQASAVAAAGCIISSPAQYGTDMTPVITSYPGISGDACGALLKTGETQIHAVPAGKPVCDLTVKGIEFVVYGTGAAQFVCAALPTS